MAAKRICILGAGIVGLATAYVFRQAGFDVTVVDAAPTPAAGASGGNGAQLSYSYVQPLADPALWRQLPALLLAAESPLKVRLQLDRAQWRWGLAFLAACRRDVSIRTTARLLALAAESRAAFDALRADIRPDCDFSATGKLVLLPDAGALAAASRQVARQHAAGGAAQAVLGRAEAVALEPALAGYAPAFAGAVHTPSECAADCRKLALALAETLQARGVRFVLGTSVRGLHVHQGRARAARCGPGAADAIEAEHFVLALGSHSAAFARQLGVYLPVYPLKGYSITVDVAAAPAGSVPVASVTDARRKVVFAPLGSRLRVAGMAELAGHDDTIPAERIATLRAATAAVFPALQANGLLDGPLAPWAGQRPATPTGFPLLGRYAGLPPNVLLNTGHGALGFTLACGSAARVRDQLLAHAD